MRGIILVNDNGGHDNCLVISDSMQGIERLKAICPKSFRVYCLPINSYEEWSKAVSKVSNSMDSMYDKKYDKK